MPRFWVLIVASLLSGCALPPAVTLVSLALDATSYVVSGKTVTDHGISLVLDRDCALLRALEGEICRETADFEVALATLTPLPATAETAALREDAAPDPGDRPRPARGRQSATLGRSDSPAVPAFGPPDLFADTRFLGDLSWRGPIAKSGNLP